jgi:hypothetical protein
MFTSLRLDTMDRVAMKRELDAIGRRAAERTVGSGRS